MSLVRVDSNYRIEIPLELRSLLRVGDEVEIRVDEKGAVVMTLPRVIDEVLNATAGLWANRSDIPTDGVAYVDALRSGNRLTRLGISADGR